MVHPLKEAAASPLSPGSLTLSPPLAMHRGTINLQEHSISKRKNKAGNKMLYDGPGTPDILFASAQSISNVGGRGDVRPPAHTSLQE
jgi:hypothetical protein